eukprot:1672533-Rhodomonas_salina.3
MVLRTCYAVADTGRVVPHAGSGLLEPYQPRYRQRASALRLVPVSARYRLRHLPTPCPEKSGTDIRHATTRIRRATATKLPLRRKMAAPERYAVSGTEAQYGARSLVLRHEYDATRTRTSRCISSKKRPKLQPYARSVPAYARPMRFPVLRYRVVLSAYLTSGTGIAYADSV